MKTRQGFVSNSSSQSFIISGDAYEDIFELAMDMIKFREWENDVKLIKKIKMAKESKEYALNAPLAFDSCNYDTYIVKEYNPSLGKEVYYITTCHNHYYDLQGIIGGNGREDINEKYYFWWPEYDILARSASYIEMDDAKMDHYCKEHFHDLLMLRNRKIICPQCKKEKKNED